MKEHGVVLETFIFATEDELLKKIIMSVVEYHDITPLLRRIFTNTEYQEVMRLVAEVNTEERLKKRDSFTDTQYLLKLIEHEERELRNAFSAQI